MTNEQLKAKYSKHYAREMGNFDFHFEEITFEIMADFSGWSHMAFEDMQGIIFYQED